MAAIAYAGLPGDDEDWCWERRNLTRFECSQLAAPGLHLSLGISQWMGPLGICAPHRLWGLK